MACERYREALADRAAGAPAPVGLESHLASCAGCREEADALRRALALADTEMAGLLSAEPSPELAARVRQTLAGSEPGRRFAWLWPATAAAAPLLVAVAVWLGRTPTPSPETRTAVDASAIARDSFSPGPQGSAGVEGPSSQGRSRASEGDRVGDVADRRPPVPTRTIPSEPEVLVPPGEAEALLRFATLVNRRAVAQDSLLVADLSAPLPEPNAIEIPPLEIVPLDPAEKSGTD